MAWVKANAFNALKFYLENCCFCVHPFVLQRHKCQCYQRTCNNVCSVATKNPIRQNDDERCHIHVHLLWIFCSRISTLQHHRRRRKHQIDETSDTFLCFIHCTGELKNTIYLLNFALWCTRLRKLPLVFHFYAGIAFI